MKIKNPLILPYNVFNGIYYTGDIKKARINKDRHMLSQNTLLIESLVFKYSRFYRLYKVQSYEYLIYRKGHI